MCAEKINKNNSNYPYLPEGREILYVSEDNPFLREAKDAADNLSTDSSHPTGAVVVKEGKIIGKAGNQTPIGNNDFLMKIHKTFCVRKVLKIPSGKGYWICPGCANYSDHAEQQAIRDAIKKGNDTRGADLYLWGHWWCCESCWNKMIGSGIKNVYLLDKSRELFGR